MTYLSGGPVLRCWCVEFIIDPAWAPNGQLLAFSWRMFYDIYIMVRGTQQIVELRATRVATNAQLGA